MLVSDKRHPNMTSVDFNVEKSVDETILVTDSSSFTTLNCNSVNLEPTAKTAVYTTSTTSAALIEGAGDTGWLDVVANGGGTWTDQSSNAITVSGSDITIVQPGLYKVQYSVFFQVTGTNLTAVERIDFGVGVNGDPTRISTSITANNDSVGPDDVCFGTEIFSLTTGDRLGIYQETTNTAVSGGNNTYDIVITVHKL